MNGGMPGGYTPPVPTRRQGGNSYLAWSLVGCGVIGVLIVVIGGFMVKRALKNLDTKSIVGVVSSMEPTAENVKKVGAGIEAYKKDHQGKYPASLEALVPNYLADKSALLSAGDTPQPMEYTVPKPNAVGGAVVVRVHVGDIVTYNQRQIMYMCLLKSGEIDSEQTVRTVFQKPGAAEAEKERSY
jgi:hypothetical protein